MSTPSESSLAAAMSAQIPMEKPHHYTYLKEFRTQQCPLFREHKCTQHRPYTCFHWHFLNQRRRRPVRKRDGTFSYSPDEYCMKYDETTGVCPDGDECFLLHRVAGDVERRYHLRYYKTGLCVHDTDSRGHCTKNGPHCAFAHGTQDLRVPIYDLRELQGDVGASGGSLDKEKFLLDDPKWNDTDYVLAAYKTEHCKRPPRLCRQGYACPQWHNPRDRRRSPKIHKYRSTPCPSVKHGDEWGDPGQCESGDNCSYCHTRTEQQFHPEIYKSTKCNDMVQTSYCPRGPFCAFAHVEQEMTTQRELNTSDNSLAAFVSSVLPETSSGGAPGKGGMGEKRDGDQTPTRQQPMPPDPIGKERTNSMSQDGAPFRGSSSLDSSYLLSHMADLHLGGVGGRARHMSVGNHQDMSPLAPSVFYHPPGGDTVGSVLGSALDDQLDDLDLSSIDRDLQKEQNEHEARTGLSQSMPVNIPGGPVDSYHGAIGSLGSLSQSPLSPLGSLNLGPFSQHNNLASSWDRFSAGERGILSPGRGSNFGPSNGNVQVGSAPGSGPFMGVGGRVHRPSGGSVGNPWDGPSDPFAPDSWKKDAEEKMRMAEQEKIQAFRMRDEVLAQMSHMKADLESLQQQQGGGGVPFLHQLNRTIDVPTLALPVLLELQNQLRTDLDFVNKVVYQQQAAAAINLAVTAGICMSCGDRKHVIVTQQCGHRLLCEMCAAANGRPENCPLCSLVVAAAGQAQQQQQQQQQR